MAIQSKDDAQSKADRKVDRSFNKKEKQRQIPLAEREFRDLVTLADQLEWVKLKKKQKEQEW